MRRPTTPVNEDLGPIDDSFKEDLRRLTLLFFSQVTYIAFRGRDRQDSQDCVLLFFVYWSSVVSQLAYCRRREYLSPRQSIIASSNGISSHLMSLRAVTAFPIHDENESSFHRGILKHKDNAAVPVMNDATSGVPSVVKPTLAPKSERKALSTLNNNALNSRVLPNHGKLGLGKAGAPGSILKPVTMEKKPKIQFLPVSTTLPAPVASQIYIPAVCTSLTASREGDVGR